MAETGTLVVFDTQPVSTVGNNAAQTSLCVRLIFSSLAASMVPSVEKLPVVRAGSVSAGVSRNYVREVRPHVAARSLTQCFSVVIGRLGSPVRSIPVEHRPDWSGRSGYSE
ncbi:MAG: hypothetical protein Fues2KO_53560 [Fuerstiella sp.]